MRQPVLVAVLFLHRIFTASSSLFNRRSQLDKQHFLQQTAETNQPSDGAMTND
jgi:hypothetical protein